MAEYNDFIGFTFNGRHSSEFNLFRTSDSDRYSDTWVPGLSDTTEDIPGGTGKYYAGETIKEREFKLNCAYDNISEEQKREIREWLHPDDQLHELILDEKPYVKYFVKAGKEVIAKELCFEEKEENNNIRVYKGEAELNFTAYYPYGLCRNKDLSNYTETPVASKIYAPNKSQWAAASGLIDNPPSTWEGTGQVQQIDIYNPGDKDTDFELIFDKDGGRDYTITANGSHKFYVPINKIENTLINAPISSTSTMTEVNIIDDKLNFTLESKQNSGEKIVFTLSNSSDDTFTFCSFSFNYSKKMTRQHPGLRIRLGKYNQSSTVTPSIYLWNHQDVNGKNEFTISYGDTKIGFDDIIFEDGRDQTEVKIKYAILSSTKLWYQVTLNGITKSLVVENEYMELNFRSLEFYSYPGSSVYEEYQLNITDLQTNSQLYALHENYFQPIKIHNDQYSIEITNQNDIQYIDGYFLKGNSADKFVSNLGVAYDLYTYNTVNCVTYTGGVVGKNNQSILARVYNSSTPTNSQYKSIQTYDDSTNHYVYISNRGSDNRFSLNTTDSTVEITCGDKSFTLAFKIPISDKFITDQDIISLNGGKIKINTQKNLISYSLDEGITWIACPDLLINGKLFKLPKGSSTLRIESNIISSTPNPSITYNYLYI